MTMGGEIGPVAALVLACPRQFTFCRAPRPPRTACGPGVRRPEPRPPGRLTAVEAGDRGLFEEELDRSGDGDRDERADDAEERAADEGRDDGEQPGQASPTRLRRSCRPPERRRVRRRAGLPTCRERAGSRSGAGPAPASTAGRQGAQRGGPATPEAAGAARARSRAAPGSGDSTAAPRGDGGGMPGAQ